jgi:hypothetical protein
MTRMMHSLRASVLLALCVVFVAAPSAAPASTATKGFYTQGFYIYNFTGATLKVTEVHPYFTQPVFEPVPEKGETNVPLPPQVGDLLSPGGRMHVELISKYGQLRKADVRFEQFPKPKSGRSRDYELSMITGDTNYLPTQWDVHCTTIRVGQCSVDGATLKLLDPPGTHITIPATDAPAQAAVIADVCTEANSDSGGTCKFDPKTKESTTAPAELVGDPVVNCLPEKIEPDVQVDHKVGTTNSLEVGAEFEYEEGFVVGKVKFAVSTKYGHEWIDEYTYKQRIPVPIEPGHVGWVVHATPVVRFTGDFTLTVGNTSFTLTGVYFDHPDKGRAGAYFVKTRDLKPGELQDCQGDDVMGGLRLPDSAVTVVHSATTGSDILRGGPESEVFRGLSGNDIMGGGGGNDTLVAGPGDDLLVGSSGHDVIDGGPGADTIIDTRGPALIRTGTKTGPGWDYVYVRDGRADDTVICGSRHTYVVADKGDRVRGHCGEVIRRGPIDRPTALVGWAGS